MKRISSLSTGVLLAVLLSACGPRKDDSHTIRVSGAWALYPLMIQWAEAYKQVDPSVRIDVSAGGAGKGITDSLAGLVDLGMVSREVTKEEQAKGAVAIPVARDATFPIMNASNPSSGAMGRIGLSKPAARALWMDRKNLTWRDLSMGPYSGKVQVYTRSDACGAGEVWAKYLEGRQPDLAGVGVYGDPGIAEAVRKDANGIGYSNLGYAFDPSTGRPVEGLTILPLDGNGNGAIDPEEDVSTRDKAMSAIRKGAYPSPPARDLYLVSRGTLPEPARSFVTWILNDGQKIVGPSGYIQVHEDALKQARGMLAK